MTEQAKIQPDKIGPDPKPINGNEDNSALNNLEEKFIQELVDNIGGSINEAMARIEKSQLLKDDHKLVVAMGVLDVIIEHAWEQNRNIKLKLFS